MTSDKKQHNLLTSRDIIFSQLRKDSKLHKVINTKKTEKIMNNTYDIYKVSTFSKNKSNTPSKSYKEYFISYQNSFEFHRKYNTKLSMEILNNTKKDLLEFIVKSK